MADNRGKRRYNKAKNYSTEDSVKNEFNELNNINNIDLTLENLSVKMDKEKDVKVYSEEIKNDSGNIFIDSESMKKEKEEPIFGKEAFNKVESKKQEISKELKVGKVIAKGPVTVTVLDNEGHGILLKGRFNVQVGEYLEYFR